MNWLTTLLLAIVAVVAGLTAAIILHKGPLVQVNLPVPPTVEQTLNHFIQEQETSVKEVGSTASAIRHQAWITTGIVAVAMFFLSMGFYLLFRVIENLSHVEERRAEHDIQSQNIILRVLAAVGLYHNGNGKKLSKTRKRPKPKAKRRQAKRFTFDWSKLFVLLRQLSSLHLAWRVVAALVLSFLILQLP